MIPILGQQACQVTVLMTVYQTPVRFLRQAVESILCQTYSQLQFLIVMDGLHQHEQLDCLKQYADSRLWLEQTPHSGLTSTLNSALPHIQTPFILRQDADDFSHPGRLEACLHHMDEWPKCGVLGDDYAYVDETGKVTHINTADPEAVPPSRYKAFGLAGTLAGGGVLLRTAAVHQVGGWSYPVAQDCYMLHAIRALGWSVKRLPITLYYWRKHRGQITEQNRQLQQDCVQQILAEFADDSATP